MIGKIITKVVQWVVTSSKDPQKTSLAFKGVLVAVVTVLSISAGLGHINLPIESLTPITDLLIQWVQTALLLVSLTASIWGAVRKVYLTATGQNAVAPQV